MEETCLSSTTPSESTGAPLLFGGCVLASGAWLVVRSEITINAENYNQISTGHAVKSMKLLLLNKFICQYNKDPEDGVNEEIKGGKQMLLWPVIQHVSV